MAWIGFGLQSCAQLPSCGSSLLPPSPAQVDEPYRNIPTEQLKHQLLKDKAEVGGIVARQPCGGA